MEYIHYRNNLYNTLFQYDKYEYTSNKIFK